MEPSYTVWPCETCRITSFHPVDGYLKQYFMTHEFPLNDLQQPQNQGYMQKNGDI